MHSSSHVGFGKHYSVVLLLLLALAGNAWGFGETGGFTSGGSGRGSGSPTGTAGGGLSGSYPNPTVSSIDGTQKWNIQFAAGNAQYGVIFVSPMPIINEVLQVSGTITHISCRNITGGACTTPISINAYKIHLGGETDGTSIACSSTQQIKGAVSSQAESLTFVAGDEVGVFITTPNPSGCTAPWFDVDMLVTEP